MIKPSLDEAKKLAQGYTMLPMALEILSDLKTPIEILRNIKANSDSFYILESINGSDNWGRYTFIGYNPVVTMYGMSSKITIDDGSDKTESTEDYLSFLKAMTEKYKSPGISYMPPFTGGFVGYFAYDFVENLIPNLSLKGSNPDGFRDFHLMLMDKVIVFDNFRQKIYIIVNIDTDDIENSYIKGVTMLKDMEKLILEPTVKTAAERSCCGSFSPRLSKDEFIARVGTVKSHIAEGDIFQAVISNRFTAHFKGSLMNTYRILRTINPSPYMAYMQLDDMEIACSSPETLISLRNGIVSSFPLAGTCPRGRTSDEDEQLISRLLSDEKELAEHDMLVDSARNDIGKISSFGSVNVNQYRNIKSFSHVSHISSQVTGRLKQGLSAIDAIAAALPAGTLSGAPKKRACEIIDETENARRGVYGGALGYIDFTGNMDMCICIRMAVLKDCLVHVQSGAGIIAESIAEKEYEEIENKAGAVMQALADSREV